MTVIRTFIAVEMPAAVRQSAQQLIRLLDGMDVKVKWVEPENMHLTIKFLGDVPEADIRSVCAAVADGVREIPPMTVGIVGAGAFPSPARPRTIWIGAGQGGEEIGALHKAIDAALAELGFPKEGRRFHPHLTLGRVRGGRSMDDLARRLEQNARFDAGTARIDQAVIFASRLTRSGPEYSVLGRAPLLG